MYHKESTYKLKVLTTYGDMGYLVTQESLEIFMPKYFTEEETQLDGVMFEKHDIHDISFQKKVQS